LFRVEEKGFKRYSEQRISSISNQLEKELQARYYQGEAQTKCKRVRTSRTKLILRGRVCNIPGCEARNRENTEVCIAFMHRKSGKFFALLNKTCQSD
jgi:hypothetical protein